MQTAEALARQFHRLADEQLNARARGIFEAVLDHQDLTLDSIPGRGRSFLVGHANHGRSIDVTERVHPSLKRLLNRVGQLFGVPLLGVDMIVRDPSAAFDYKEDVIIEVNPAPAFAMHERPAVGMSRNFSGTILKHLFPTGNGAARVPVVAGPVGCGPQLEELAQALRRNGVHPTGYTRNIAWSGTPRDERGRGPLGFSLLPLDSMAEVLLLEIDEVLAGVIGLPVDRVDFLVGNSSTPTQVDRMLARLRHRRKQERVSIGNVLKACRPVPRRNKEK
jgi:hypothetical protein